MAITFPKILPFFFHHRDTENTEENNPKSNVKKPKSQTKIQNAKILNFPLFFCILIFEF